MPSLEVRGSRDGYPPVTKWEREIHLNGTRGVILWSPGRVIAVRAFSLGEVGATSNSTSAPVMRTVGASMRALLALEDGRVFEGQSFGATGTTVGEVCFNTSMTGYQEVVTDPSYRGQIVAMTYPLIGNYGTNTADAESRSPHVRGFVIEELSRVTSNWRAEHS